jgi:hypothetical protein
MMLQEALDQVGRLDDGKVIFARRPWTLDTEAEIATLDENLGVREVIRNRGLEYFLEVSVAEEVLEVFKDREPTVEERRALLLFYAEHDAYPGWVYDET